MNDANCSHFAALTEAAEPSSTGCQQCLDVGDTWVHLRACLGCGQVGCCDSSKNRHARGHWQDHADHPLVRSIEPGETWKWCFADEVWGR